MTARLGEKPGSGGRTDAGSPADSEGCGRPADLTGGRTANIYQFACGAVAYFAPDAPDFQEAGEVSGAVVERYRRFWEM